MTKGRTLLFVKDPTLGNGASDLLLDEQKGAKKQSRGTHDLLFIDKMVTCEMLELEIKTCSRPGRHAAPLMDKRMPGFVRNCSKHYKRDCSLTVWKLGRPTSTFVLPVPLDQHKLGK